jgi:hypothetical protein
MYELARSNSRSFALKLACVLSDRDVQKCLLLEEAKSFDLLLWMKQQTASHFAHRPEWPIWTNGRNQNRINDDLVLNLLLN